MGPSPSLRSYSQLMVAEEGGVSSSEMVLPLKLPVLRILIQAALNWAIERHEGSRGAD